MIIRRAKLIEEQKTGIAPKQIDVLDNRSLHPFAYSSTSPLNAEETFRHRCDVSLVPELDGRSAMERY
jgi:hypothetical protein